MPTEKEFLAKKAELDLKQDKLTAGDNITINPSTNVISATDTTYSDVTGATSQTAGVHGLVPAPAAGDESKFLKGDGTWDTVSAGADVEANPQDTPSDTLSTIGIDGVVYEIEGGGGGSDVVVDPTITSGTKIADITVDGDTSSLYAPEVSLTYAEYIALTEQEKNNGTTYYITDMDAGKVNIFAPVIYSQQEREIGVWIDNKPLYSRVFDLGSDVQVSYNSFTDTSIDASSIEKVVDAKGFYSTGVTAYNVMVNINNNIIRLQTDRNGVAASIRYVLLFYTKTTDVAGSGDWTNSGAPTTQITYNTPFDTGKRINNKIVYGYYNISSDVPRANWNDCVRELTGLPNDITMTHWDIKYITNNNVWWQKGEPNDSLYITQSAEGWYVTCYWVYSGASTCKIYTYIEFTMN